MPEFLSWWNLVFFVPFVISFILFFIMRRRRAPSITVAEIQDDLKADSHTGASFDWAHDFDHETGHYIEYETSGRGSFGNHTSQEVTPESRGTRYYRIILAYLGSDKISPGFILPIFFFFWGVSGYLLNIVFRRIVDNDPLVYVLLSILGAFIVASLLTRSVSVFLGKYAGLSSNYATQREELVGCVGEAVYKITLESGMAQVCDERATLHRINCRIEPKSNVINEGDRVVIVGYDSSDDLYLVRRS